MMIKKPSLIINQEIAKENIRKMISLTKQWDMDFRPHFKTHQSAKIANWFKAEGVNKCAVSSLSMASYFAANGWTDISVAIPVNLLEIEDVRRLSKLVKLYICVDHQDSCEFLSKNIQESLNVFIEIDTTYARSGINYLHTKKTDHLLKILEAAPSLQFTGFLSHSGQTYQAKTGKEIAPIFEETRQQMMILKEKYLENHPQMIISMGDTPASTFANDFRGIDEWRPGNFIFYDLMQYTQGICKQEEIALIVRCPVIGIYLERKELVIYGGGIHLSKESTYYQGSEIFGWLKNMEESIGVGQEEYLNGFPVISLSQEHGIIAASEEFLSQIKIGDLVDIIPVHSCMTADLYAAYLSENGQLIKKFRSNS
ncbi:MAG: alanine racemase [Bacteroidales bacterium]|nr:alanine racemase [Bacteroidales bacterium]